jgi:hypothetical protein
MGGLENELQQMRQQMQNTGYQFNYLSSINVNLGRIADTLEKMLKIAEGTRPTVVWKIDDQS